MLCWDSKASLRNWNAYLSLGIDHERQNVRIPEQINNFEQWLLQFTETRHIL